MDLLTVVRNAMTEGVNVRSPRDKLVNIYPAGRDVAAADVDAARAALKAAGYEEARSWIAAEGMSWLSPGITSVSIEVR